jgi:hypothetical protein
MTASVHWAFCTFTAHACCRCTPINWRCGGPEDFVEMSADDLEQQLLPVLGYADSEAALVAIVQALVIVKRQGIGRRRKRGRAGCNWNQG